MSVVVKRTTADIAETTQATHLGKSALVQQWLSML